MRKTKFFNAYREHFGVKMGDQHKPCMIHFCRANCRFTLEGKKRGSCKSVHWSYDTFGDSLRITTMIVFLHVGYFTMWKAMRQKILLHSTIKIFAAFYHQDL